MIIVSSNDLLSAMSKIFKIFLLILSLWFYNQAEAGCQNGLPSNGVVTAKGPQVSQGFYLDPLLPIANAKVDPKLLVRITFPNFNLFLATINNGQRNFSKLGKRVKIGRYYVYQQETSDAAMCHQYRYFSYFLPKRDKIDVFIFLVTANCFDKPAPIDTSAFKKVLTCLMQ
jgi:hypothetical protein